MSQQDHQTVVVSNGEDFFEIPASDVATALSEGFYLPRERGLTIVAKENEVFEIPVVDLPAALQDGFRDLIPDSEEPSLSTVDSNDAASVGTEADTDWDSKTGSGVRCELDSSSKLSSGGAASFQPNQPASERLTETGVAAGESDERDSLKNDSEPDVGEHDDVAVHSQSGNPTVFGLDRIVLEELEDREAQRRKYLKDALLTAEGMEKLKFFVLLQIPSRREVDRFMRSYGISTLLHAVLLVMLGFLVFKSPPVMDMHVISSVMSDAELEAPEEGPPVEIDVTDDAVQPTDDAAQLQDMLAMTRLADVDLSPESLKLDITGAGEPAAAADVEGGGMTQSGTAVKGALGARSVAISKYGGTPTSEAAVEAALDWLARHQESDGSWCFRHSSTPECNCPGAGTHEGRTGATGAALLTYFGAGYTFADGPRAGTIRRGLQFLLQSIEISPTGYGELREKNSGHGGIYQHGLATAALCEALAVNRVLVRMINRDRKVRFIDSSGYEVTLKDLTRLGKTLRNASQLAVNYTVVHQDPKQGGWGYEPKSAGDTSILGWQVMSLISARSEDLEIPPQTWAGVANFLQTVSSDNGFAYRPGGPPKNSTTAIGVLCQMFTGATRSDPQLRLGVEHICAQGPARSEMYYNYYATQAVFAWGDEEGESGRKLWTEWNNRTRDMLVATQQKEGHLKGSWAGDGAGGRHFATCLAAMTLEIYYRKLPVYQRLSLEPIELN